MDLEEARGFAEHWIAAWNSHDIDAVLAHYTDDFAMTTPMIQRVPWQHTTENQVGPVRRTGPTRVCFYAQANIARFTIA